jgi:hypothetical protein
VLKILLTYIDDGTKVCLARCSKYLKEVIEDEGYLTIVKFFNLHGSYGGDLVDSITDSYSIGKSAHVRAICKGKLELTEKVDNLVRSRGENIE